ncbi:MAG: DUF2480 family protein [Microscillaceae bacterium]|nr:DUF2480 family protein [Microscillaceae bacterium]MDW8461500.1 DUF2480 family protein [Cytophagales bacterium]
MEEIINRVAKSSLQTIDLENLYPQGKRILYDLKENLFQGLVLREKEFREFLKNHDWTQYKDAYVAITCSADAIVPTWAYMLLAVHLAPYAQKIVFGDLQALESELFREKIENLDLTPYHNAKVVVKGCSKVEVPTSAYVELSAKLQPIVQSLMFGEPCSTVPLYKKAKHG